MDKRITEQASHHRHLEKMSTGELLNNINNEDRKVASAVYLVIPAIECLVDAIHNKMKDGGRLFYIGAGTSGRLGILDASECPPTFGVPHGMVIGLIAGGDVAIRKSVEQAEDDINQAWKDLKVYDITDQDCVIGIAASGTTPYVVNGLKDCKAAGILTGCITCNPKVPIIDHANFPIVVIVGPEFLTGSSRMRAGTAQKMICNMITTSVMIKLGKVKDNRMVDMQLSNDKLWDRGARMVQEKLNVSFEEAKLLLEKKGSVRKVIEGN